MSQINFVAEFRAIMETCRRDSVPGRTRLLWIALFYLANDRAQEDEQTGAWEWPDEFFSVNNAELATHCPLEKRAMLEARNRLKQMGVIDFRAGDNAMKPAKYRIKYLSAGQRCKNAPQGVPQQVPQQVPQGVPQDAPQGAPYNINIKREIRVNPDVSDDDEDDDVFRARAREEAVEVAFAGEIGRKAYPAEVGRIAHAAGAFGFSAEMAGEAVREAARHGARDPAAYAVTLMDEWRGAEVRTPEQIGEFMAEKDIRSGKLGLYAVADPREEAERRRKENREAGIL